MRGHDITESAATPAATPATPATRVRRAGLGGRRVPRGPRPVRPGVSPVGVRPAQPSRPVLVPAAAGAAVRIWPVAPCPPPAPEEHVPVDRAADPVLAAPVAGFPARESAVPLPRPHAVAGRLVESLAEALVESLRGVRQRGPARRAPIGRRPLDVRMRVRELLSLAGLMVATAAAVVALGLLAGAVAQSRAEPAVGPTIGTTTADTVVVGTETTVWEVAQRVAPGASGPELGELTERIVEANGLSTVRVHPGQELRVIAG